MIPKKIHLTWKDKDLLESSSPIVSEGVRKLIDLNPDWSAVIHDDEDVDNYLREKLGSDYSLIANGS